MYSATPHRLAKNSIQVHKQIPYKNNHAQYPEPNVVIDCAET